MYSVQIFHHSISIILSITVLSCPSLSLQRSEQPCWGRGGQCMPSSRCRNAAHLRTGWCPSQPNDVKCCLPYPETPCQNAGGSCQRADLGCSGGSFHTGLCPTQPSDVRCCTTSKTRPTSLQRAEQPCWGRGGQCMPSAQCRSAAHLKTGWCPSQPGDVKCCLPYPETPCQNAGGSCKRADLGCSGGIFHTGLCPTQPTDVRCCSSKGGGAGSTPVASGDCKGSACNVEIAIPPEAKSQSYSSVSLSAMKAYFGTPCSTPPARIISPRLSKVVRTIDLGPFNAYGMEPFLSALARVFAKLKREKPGVYATIGFGGTFNCRTVRKTSTWSNHAYGAAIDLTINGRYDPYNNGRVFAGLRIIHHYMAEEGLFWGAGYKNSEDGMHFEVSTQLFTRWKSEGKI